MNCLRLSALFLLVTASAAAAQPNILWLSSEDHNPHMGCYGDTYATTPNIDKLAARSLRYTHAWAAAPVCAPTRTTIISGIHAPSSGGDHMRSMVAYPAGQKMFPQLLREAGYYTSNHVKEDYNLKHPGQTWDVSSAQAHWRNRPGGKPFFAVFNSTKSHESQTIRGPAVKPIHDPAKVRVPAYHPDTPEVRRDWAFYYDSVTAADADAGEVLAQLAADGLADDTIIFYWGDHGSGMPRSKRWPSDSGLHVPLVVHIPEKFKNLRPADYRSGGTTDRLVSFADFAPTMCSLAGVKPPEWMQGYAFLGRFIAPAQPYVYGFRGRMDERYDLSYAVTDGRHRYIRNYLPHVPAGQHLDFLWRQSSMREWAKLYSAGKLNAVQSAFFRERAPEELFDLAADPDNVRNLAAAPAQRAVLERLRAAHHAHLLRIRDAGLMPEPMMIPLAGARSPRTITQNEAVYPLARLVDLLDRLQLPPTPAPKDLAAALADPLPVVRYWGTMAAIRSPAVAAATLERLLADPEPVVRLGAAQALLRGAESAAVWKVIADCLAPGQLAELRLTAMNVITLQQKWPESLRPLIAAPSAAKNASGENYVARAAEFLLAPNAAPVTRAKSGGR